MEDFRKVECLGVVEPQRSDVSNDSAHIADLRWEPIGNIVHLNLGFLLVVLSIQ